MVVFSPRTFSHIQSSETFYNLKIGYASWDGSVYISQEKTVNVTNNLDIDKHGLWLTQSSNLNVYGNVSISNEGDLVVQGNHIGNAFAYIAGDLTLSSSSFHINNGDVTHQGHLVTTPDSQFRAVRASYINSADGTWQLINCQWEVGWDSTIEFTNKGIQLLAGSDILLENYCTMKTGKSFQATSEEVMENWWGVLEFIGATQASIVLSTGNDLYDVNVNKTAASVVLQNDVKIRSNLNIDDGTFNSNGYTVEIWGDWSNNVGSAGYICGTSEVIFKYNLDTFCQLVRGTQTFYDVTVDHISNSTYIDDHSSSNMTVLNNLVIIQGNMDINYLNANNISIPETSYLKVWILELHGDVVDENPVIINSIEQKTGLIISSAMYVKGSDDQYLNIAAPSFWVYSLEIDKNGGAFKPTKPLLMNNLDIENGTWSYHTPGLGHTVYGNFEIGAGGAWVDDTGTLTFAGESTDSNVKIYGNANFNNIIINKTNAARSVNLIHTDWNTSSTADFIIQRGIFRIEGRSFQTEGNITVMNGGKLSLVNNASVRMYSSRILCVQSGGILETHGSETQKALFTNVNGMNEFWIQSGGTISASNTIFEKAGYNGVYVMNGAYVDPAHSFTNCEFRYGFMFGTLLTINNNQHLAIDNPVFISSNPPWGSTYNVSKNENWGSLTINGESGAFAGYLYEWDPFTRVNWSTDIPGFWASSTGMAFGEVSWGSTAFQLLDVYNTGSAPLSGVIIVPDGFSAEPYGRFNQLTNSREALDICKTDTEAGSYRSSTLDFQLNPGSGMTYKVSFVPPLPGAYDANMVFYHNAPTATHTVNLTGFSRGARIVANPDTLFFELLPGAVGNQILNVSNAGNDSLGYYANVSYTSSRSINTIIQEGFEGAFPPMGWMEQIVSGTDPAWGVSNNTVHPSGQAPHGGSFLAYFNSYTCLAGASKRLISPSITLMGTYPSELSFWMYHDIGYSTRADRIQVQVSTDWFTWHNLGAPINRYNSDTGWEEHIIDLTTYNGSTIYIGLLGISEYGNDIHIDDFHVYNILPPTGWVSLNGTPETMGTVFPGDAPASVNVQANAQELPAGSYQATIYIYSNDYIDWFKRIPLILTVGTPGLAFSEPYLHWNTIPVGISALEFVSIQNPGAITLDATISTTDGFEIVDPPGVRMDSTIDLAIDYISQFNTKSSFKPPIHQEHSLEQPIPGNRNTVEVSIPAGGSNGIYIAFTPTAVQGYSGTLLVTSDALPDASIALFGTGVSAPSVQTISVESVTNQSAIVNAVVNMDGGMMLLERGVCFNPTLP